MRTLELIHDDSGRSQRRRGEYTCPFGDIQETHRTKSTNGQRRRWTRTHRALSVLPSVQYLGVLCQQRHSGRFLEAKLAARCGCRTGSSSQVRNNSYAHRNKSVTPCGTGSRGFKHVFYTGQPNIQQIQTPAHLLKKGRVRARVRFPALFSCLLKDSSKHPGQAGVTVPSLSGELCRCMYSRHVI